MKFLTLEIQNFGRIEEAEITLAGRGLVLIQGENGDDSSASSNGAGKSTVVEALSWCVYGMTAKHKKPADAIVNRKHGKNCRVAVRMRDEDGTEYLIERHRKHKKHKNEVLLTQINADGTTVDLSKGTDAATQPEIDAVMGCGYDVFISAIYAGQEKMPDLPSMTDKQLKSLIEEAAGLNTLDKAYELARSDLSDANAALTAHNTVVERARSVVESKRDVLKSLKESADIWESQRRARLVDLNTELRSVLASIKPLTDRAGELSSLEQIEAEREALRESFKRIEVQNKKLDELRNAERVAERAVDLAASRSSHATANCRSLLENYNKVKAAIGQPCDTCGRPHDGDTLKVAIDNAANQVRESRKVMKKEESAVEAAQTAFKTASEARKDFERTLISSTDLVAANDEISQRERATTSVLNKITELKTRGRDLASNSKKEKEAQNPHTARVESASDEVSAAEQKLADLEAATAQIEREVAIKTEIARVFSPKGVRAHILDTVTPFLNTQTAHYLATLSDGRFEAVWNTLKVNKDGSLSERFSIEAKDTEDGGTFADMSGGERRKVRIATALALQDLVATRAVKSLDLWIGDEIDQALDPSGLERLMSVLNEKARERETVLVISHSDLRDWFSNAITVVREGETSRVKC